MLTPEQIAAPGTEHSPLTVRRRERVSAGLCRDCGKVPPIPRKIVCEPCGEYRSTYGKSYRLRRKKDGICGQCGGLAADEKTVCNACTQVAVNKYRDRRRYNKAFLINYYGGKCVVCGETDLVVLTLDHVNNDGNIDRNTKKGRVITSAELYAKLVKLIKDGKRPKRSLQILCFNDHARKDLRPWYL